MKPSQHSSLSAVRPIVAILSQMSRQLRSVRLVAAPIVARHCPLDWRPQLSCEEQAGVFRSFLACGDEYTRWYNLRRRSRDDERAGYLTQSCFFILRRNCVGIFLRRQQIVFGVKSESSQDADPILAQVQIHPIERGSPWRFRLNQLRLGGRHQWLHRSREPYQPIT